MQNSSNTSVNDVLKQVSRIKKVEPNPNLYAQTLRKINGQSTISFFFVKAAACLLIAFISAEIYVAFQIKKTQRENISSLIYITNNILYHE